MINQILIAEYLDDLKTEQRQINALINKIKY
jgi:hypothetical protein